MKTQRGEGTLEALPFSLRYAGFPYVMRPASLYRLVDVYLLNVYIHLWVVAAAATEGGRRRGNNPILIKHRDFFRFRAAFGDMPVLQDFFLRDGTNE